MQLGFTLAASELTGRKVDQLDREERDQADEDKLREEFPEWSDASGD